ncbi:MAG: hypothetical protein CSA33_00530 [Desulfobulbus propionicus]|nr:MAG: hypothetical protein CSA33_00530 [Desulfobulbus propionicus]
MSVESACVFPQTVVNTVFLKHLLPVFPCLVYLKPQEGEDCLPKKQSPGIAHLLAEKRLEFLAPAPLGPLQKKFQAMCKDIEYNRESFASHIAHCNPALFNASSLETLSSITSSLSRPPQAGGGPDLTETLWQARLVLKLAEMQEQEQDEIRHALAVIQAKQQDLFHALREDPDLSCQGAAMAKVNLRTDTPGFKHRLKAWTRLLCLGEYSPSSCRVYVTPSIDAADLLLERAQQRRVLDLATAKILDLPVPAEHENNVPGIDNKLLTAWQAVLANEQPAAAQQPKVLLPGAVAKLKTDTTPCLCLYPVQGTTPTALFADTFIPDQNQWVCGPGDPAYRWLLATLITGES